LKDQEGLLQNERNKRCKVKQRLEEETDSHRANQDRITEPDKELKHLTDVVNFAKLQQNVRFNDNRYRLQYESEQVEELENDVEELRSKVRS
jgi:hypothetical protein